MRALSAIRSELRIFKCCTFYRIVIIHIINAIISIEKKSKICSLYYDILRGQFPMKPLLCETRSCTR